MGSKDGVPKWIDLADTKVPSWYSLPFFRFYNCLVGNHCTEAHFNPSLFFFSLPIHPDGFSLDLKLKKLSSCYENTLVSLDIIYCKKIKCKQK
jgi:hypothetical protein